MIISGLSLLLIGQTAEGPRETRSRVTVEQRRVIIRVPRMPIGRTSLAPSPPLPPVTWVERKATKCIAASELSAAAITRADSVDLMLRGGKRLRVKLESDCPSLGFYSGFYLKPGADGQVCAKRDVVRSRSGGSCKIRTFRTLVPGR